LTPRASCTGEVSHRKISRNRGKALSKQGDDGLSRGENAVIWEGTKCQRATGQNEQCRQGGEQGTHGQKSRWLRLYKKTPLWKEKKTDQSKARSFLVGGGG